MPHIVLGGPNQRGARVGTGNIISERYLGVLISNAPAELLPNQPAAVRLTLMYWPEEQYDGVRPEATFTLREGPKIVGFGRILSQIKNTSFEMLASLSKSAF